MAGRPVLPTSVASLMWWPRVAGLLKWHAAQGSKSECDLCDHKDSPLGLVESVTQILKRVIDLLNKRSAREFVALFYHNTCREMN